MKATDRKDRPARSMALIVNAGVIMQDHHGRKAAADFLLQSGVPLRVIARVLAEPDRRRH